MVQLLLHDVLDVVTTVHAVTKRDRWMSSKEVSASLSISVRTLYRLIDDGEIAAYRIGRAIRLKEADVASYLESVRIAPGELVHLHPSPQMPRPA